MKKINSFDNKLKLYSTLAMGVMGAGALNAQVVYHDVIPDKTLTGVSGTASRDSLQMDIDANGTDDFQMQVRIYGTTAANTQANLNSVGTGATTLASLVAYTNLGYATSIPYGTAIGATSAWNATVQAILASLYGTTNYGNLGDGTEHYLGIKFTDAASAVHYGWIRVSGVNTNGTTVTIKDWAYQSTANASINAGTITGIEDAKNIESNIYSLNKNIYLNFASECKGEINVYNSLGELILTDNLNGLKKVINMSSQANGIYFIKITSDKGDFNKKIML